jgi:predicted N-formylglutamate amidohydrolase
MKKSVQRWGSRRLIAKTTIISEVADEPCTLTNPGGGSSIVLVCEHASNRIPTEYNNLGLDDATRTSHIAWDPGASAVAGALSTLLDAKLVQSTISRLVYDCNRPPEAADCIPAKSEIYEVPGNQWLQDDDRAHRVDMAYRPFQRLLARTLESISEPALVTIHSFTPIYFGARRATEIGILHDADSRLADEMLRISADTLPGLVERNRPYGPADGVTHTLKEHAIEKGRLNVMIEIRNDLIATSAQQEEMAKAVGKALAMALTNLGRPVSLKVAV